MNYIKVPSHYFSRQWKCRSSNAVDCSHPRVRRLALRLPEHRECGWVMRVDFIDAVFERMETMEDATDGLPVGVYGYKINGRGAVAIEVTSEAVSKLRDALSATTDVNLSDEQIRILTQWGDMLEKLSPTALTPTVDVLD